MTDSLTNAELMVNVSVSNRRRREGAVVEWILTAEGDTREFKSSPIPDAYVLSRPGLYPLDTRTRETEWPVPKLNEATAQPFKHATGWLRFLIPNSFGSDRYVITAVDDRKRKHRIEWVYQDTDCVVWDVSDSAQRASVQQMHGPKPPIQ